jgi:acetoin utilization deacetylase AcuC-like enzyme
MSSLHVVLQRKTVGAVPIVLDRDGRNTPGRESEDRVRFIARGLRRLPGCRFSVADITDAEVDERIDATHRRDYVDFLARISRALSPGEIHIDAEHVAPGVRPDTPLMAGTYQLAREGVRTAMAAARAVASGDHCAYAVCRPPGHHAGPAWFGGYCYLNNAMAAALTLRAAGVGRIGILDVDFHFGNGSAALAADLSDVFFGSLHSSTGVSYPYAEMPLHNGRQMFVSFARPPLAGEYLGQLAKVLDAAANFSCEALVVSLGYDIIAGDPHGTWSLPTSMLRDLGASLTERGLPLCLVQEGGYLLGALEECAFHLGAGLQFETKEGDDHVDP